jgi:hypothetical protein
MDTFYLIVLGAASLCLILLLAFMGWTISNSNKTTRYPAITTTCPDNWTPDTTYPTKNVCIRPTSAALHNFGKVAASSRTIDNDLSLYMTTSTQVGVIANTPSKMDFSPSVWSGTDLDPTCAKKIWADKYNVKWDSVTNAAYCS